MVKLRLITNARRPIVVVDDEPLVLRTLHRTLSRWGYQVVTVQDPGEALHTVRDVQPCMVITDLLMPDLDGYELVRRIRESLGTDAPPLAVLTGDNHRSGLFRQPGVMSVLLKPAPLPSLRRLIDGVCIDHRRPPFVVDDDEPTPTDDFPNVA